MTSAEPHPPGRSRAEVPSSRRLRVIVADDHDSSRRGLQRAIEAAGHHCRTARNGVEALDAHHASPADLILSDWAMPRMDGVELCRRVRAAHAVGYTYFILVTALDDRRHLVEGLRAGADDYLTKPVDLEELEARLISAERVTRVTKRLANKNQKLSRASETSFKAARVDALTGLANRRQLDEDLEALRSRASAFGNTYCAALCDVDNFKLYNDAFGHPAGDEVLRRIGAALHAELRTSDWSYRYGGEELMAILPEQSLEQATRALERVRARVEALAIPHGPGAPHGVVTISVGVAELRNTAGASHEGWIRRADAAMYRAKSLGRNRVEIDR
jgi:two-component system, cell cycle response regulator